MPAILAAEQGQAPPAAPDQGDLLLELALSVWLRTSELGLEEARASMLALRRALLAEAGFDRASEPIPLLSRDLRQALVDLARYLADLAERAATATGRPAAGLILEALAAEKRSAEVRAAPPAPPAPSLAVVVPLRRP